MRVLIVADDVRARTGLVELLSRQPDVTVDEAAPDAFLLGPADTFGQDVIVWDLGSGAVQTPAGLPALQDLDAPVIVLGDDDTRISEAVTAGARGALSRDVGGPALLAALRAVMEGLVAIDPAFAPAIAPGRSEDPDISVEELTPREQQVLQWLAGGLSNKQIASQLGISEHTVKFHVGAIFSKLGARSRTEAVTKAARLGLIVL